MSEYFPFRLAYRSAAASAPATEARRVALWHREVIAQSNASLGKRRQDDWWTSGRLTMSTSAGRVRGGGGEEVIGFQDGAGYQLGQQDDTPHSEKWYAFLVYVLGSCIPCNDIPVNPSFAGKKNKPTHRPKF